MFRWALFAENCFVFFNLETATETTNSLLSTRKVLQGSPGKVFFQLKK